MSQAGKKKMIVVAGGGPAGLRAAEVAAESGAAVVLLEGKRYVGRKLLVAGKSGLNLTNDEALESFVAKYSGPADRWRKLIGEFSNNDLRKWAAGLGFETFVSSGGKVFPQPMKAAPLLRAWIKRLRDLEVDLRFNSRVVCIDERLVHLQNGDSIPFDALILAFGGASWPSTGSDGSWADLFAPHQVALTPFEAANCGWEVDWPESMIPDIEGKPLKNIVGSTPGHSCPGEITLTKYGIEGGPIYHLGPDLRKMEDPVITLDLKPTLSLDEVESRMSAVKKNYVREAKRRLKLCDAATALLKNLPQLGPWSDGGSIAGAIKALPIPLKGPRPIAEAISTAGGVAWSELDDSLMVSRLPGVFVAGEMIDWEAPTGGYLLQGCFATGERAAKGAIKFAESRTSITN